MSNAWIEKRTDESASPAGPAMGLTGDLGELSLPDLVQMTSVGGKTGRLVVLDEEGAVAGVLTFRGGHLVGARAGGLAAQKAFYALLGVTTGSFEFDPRAALEEDEVDLSIESLLIEGTRRLDEVHRLRQSLPAATVIAWASGSSEDPSEAQVLVSLGPGARTVGAVVEGVLADGDADEYDALTALSRLVRSGMVRIERAEESDGDLGVDRSPQPELER